MNESPATPAGTFFVAGTDTEVGKTAVSCALLAAARTRGLTTAAVKPLASGAVNGRNADALSLQRMCTVSLRYEAVNPVALTAPVAPHIAAEQEGKALRAEELAASCREVIGLGADMTLIEGVGGWMTPLNDEQTMADVVAMLGAPVILVVGMRLGCLNHALLSVEAIRRSGVELVAWVANAMPTAMPERETNHSWLECRLGVPLLGKLPRLEASSDRDLAVRLAGHLALPF